MISAVCIKSSSSGSGIFKYIPLFNFDASNSQLLIPTKETLIGFSSYSNKECITFKGLFFEISANPISSK